MKAIWTAVLLGLGLLVVMCDTVRTTETLSEISDRVFDAFHENGEVLLDYVDGSEARAQPGMGTVYSGACDQVWTAISPGGQVTTTYYFSHIQVPGLDPTQAPHVSVVVCNNIVGSNMDYLTPCSEGFQCSGWQPPKLPCMEQSSGARLGDGEVVIPCGTVMEVLSGPTLGGSHWQEVYVRVD